MFSGVDLPLLSSVMIAINGATPSIWDNDRSGGRCLLTIGCLVKLAWQENSDHLVEGFSSAVDRKYTAGGPTTPW